MGHTPAGGDKLAVIDNAVEPLCQPLGLKHLILLQRCRPFGGVFVIAEADPHIVEPFQQPHPNGGNLLVPAAQPVPAANAQISIPCDMGLFHPQQLCADIRPTLGQLQLDAVQPGDFPPDALCHPFDKFLLGVLQSGVIDHIGKGGTDCPEHIAFDVHSGCDIRPLVHQQQHGHLL